MRSTRIFTTLPARNEQITQPIKFLKNPFLLCVSGKNRRTFDARLISEKLIQLYLSKTGVVPMARLGAFPILHKEGHPTSQILNIFLSWLHGRQDSTNPRQIDEIHPERRAGPTRFF